MSMTLGFDLSTPTFDEFESIPRLFREMVVTEKIDGTNAQVHVLEDGRVLAGSRNRYITPDADNFGFASWVKAHEEELREGLGAGRHYGEWWGSGIQRGYGLTKGEKRFSLFNVNRWWSAENDLYLPAIEKRTAPPACCLVVPVITVEPFCTTMVRTLAERLALHGSLAAPGFMKPEGVVIYHKAGNHLFKYTFDKNDGHKSGGVSPKEEVR